MTFPKVVIVNAQDQILLAFDNDRKAYEVPSIGTIQGPISFKSYIDETTKEVGVTYSSFRLGGVFTYIYPDKYSTFIRPYFVVKFQDYSNGQTRLNPSYKWFSLQEALKEIKYPASAKIVEQIITRPKQVWSATFEEHGYTNPVDIKKIKFRIIENFTSLN
jgi:hypothetical protein